MFPRATGVLLPIPYLPSGFGIGDLGPYAYRFADYLHAAGQRVWQILPQNPTTPAYQHSPYHGASTFACNPLLISPEHLAAWPRRSVAVEPSPEARAVTFRKQHPPPGARPGTLAIPPDAPPPRIRVVDYGIDGFEEHELDDPEALIPFRDSPRTAWVDVHGFGDEAKLWAIAKIFGLHPLVLEDATNVPQRAKSEVRPEAHIFVARLPVLQAEGGIEVPQVCLILGRRFLLTFQARSSGFLDPVRQRIREGIGPIREQGPDYLAYAIIDT